MRQTRVDFDSGFDGLYDPNSAACRAEADIALDAVLTLLSELRGYSPDGKYNIVVNEKYRLRELRLSVDYVPAPVLNAAEDAEAQDAVTLSAN